MSLDVRNNRRREGRSSVITANRLRDGLVVWLRPDRTWSVDIGEAEIFGNDRIESAIEGARIFEQQRIVVGLYGVEIDQLAGRAIPFTERERIRAAGPTVGTDLPPPYPTAELRDAHHAD